MLNRLPIISAPFSKGEVEACEYIGPEGVFWSRGQNIFHSNSIDEPAVHLTQIPLGLIKRVLASFRAGRRLGRQTFYNIIPIENNAVFFSYGTDIGFIKDGRTEYITGRKRKSKILRNGLARKPDGSIVFGEYFSNTERDEVHLYEWNPYQRSVRVVYTFGPGEIRHVHSVSWDPFAERVVVATGDIASECQLISFNSEFTESVILGHGTEEWRTISPQFSSEAIYFGTDAEFQQNRIYRYDRGTQTLLPLLDVNGPVFYSCALGTGWLFGTTAELCPSQTSPDAILYFLDSSTEKVSLLARIPKDQWPKRYFQFGVLSFPIVQASTSRIPVSGVALKGLDGKFMMVEV